MKNGKHILYCVQQRRRAEGKWAEPESPLRALKKKGEWCFCGDFFSQALDPVVNGNKNNPAGREWHQSNMHTGYYGWKTLKFALAALRRVRAAARNGDYYSRHYGMVTQKVRHEFRLVKLTLVYDLTVEPVDCFEHLAGAA